MDRYTQEQLNSLIADVEKEFTSHLAKAEESFGLAKSEDDQPDQKKVNGAADDKKNSAKDEKTSFGENKEGGKADDSHNAAKDEKQEGADAKKEASQDKSGKPMEGEKAGDKGVDDQHQQQDGAKEGQADEGHGYDDEDMSHMHSMYSSMSKPELKAHHDVIRKCMDGMGLAKCEDGMAKAEMEMLLKTPKVIVQMAVPMMAKAAKAKCPASSDAQAMTKSEPNMEVSLLKSELEAAKADNKATKENLAAVEAFLKKFVEKTAPAGKAITSLDIIAKTEGSENKKPLTKSEIDAKLLAKANDRSLAKSDRDAINSYYFSKNIESVRHLLS